MKNRVLARLRTPRFHFWFAAGCFALVFCVDLAFLARYAASMVDSDMTGETTLLANLMLKEGRFLVPDYYYSSELKVFREHLLYCVGLLLFPGNWTLVRILCQSALLALAAGGCLYMARSFRWSWASSLLLAAAYLCPFTFWQINLITFGGHYIAHFGLMMVSLGTLVRLSRGVKKHGWLLWALLLMMALIAGINGMRLLMNFYLPLSLAAAVLYAMEQGTFQRRFARGAWAATLVNAAGYLVNSRVLAKMYSFETMNGQSIVDLRLGRFGEVFSMLLGMFGYQTTAWTVRESLFSPQGLGALMGLATMALVITAAVYLLRHQQRLDGMEKALLWYLLCAVAVSECVYSLTDHTINECYWIMVVPFAFMALGMAMKRYSFRFAWGRAAVTGVLCLCLAGSSFSAVYNYAHKPFRANDRHRQAAQWLVDHGYDKGYASYYHANVLTELSSGQLETWAMLTYADDEAHPFLQTMDHLQEAPKGRVFALVAAAEEPYFETFLQNHTFQSVELVFSDDAFLIYELQTE